MMRKFIAAFIAISLTAFAALFIPPLPWERAFAQQGTPFIPADSVSKRVSLNGSATGTTGAVGVTLTPSTGRTAYICGISVSAGSASTAITVQVTITGLFGGMQFNWALGAPVTAVGVTGPILTVPFTPCIPGSAVGGGISVASGALGTGGINNDVNVWGYQVESP
jgi:hypothetical protein